jgi:endonuclease/exonuclease/phosphatase family metal-dependent hydrolase
MTVAGRLRVATYNVHACIARDGKGVARIAEVLAAMECDVVALQEIDVGRLRTGAFHQAEEIARRLGFATAFGAAWDRGASGSYGNAVISRFPIVESRARALPESKGLRCEPRTVVEARVATPAGAVDVWCTHLGVRRHERELQGRALVETVAARAGDEPLVVLGDLNTGADGSLVRALRAHLADARRDLSRRTATYPARWPILALDHIFVGAPLTVRESQTFRGSVAATASDHLPFMAVVEWPAPSAPSPTPSEGPPGGSL